MSASRTRLLAIAAAAGLVAACQPQSSDTRISEAPPAESATPAADPANMTPPIWLDSASLAGWNTVGMAVPPAPAGLDDADARCRETAREAETAEDELVSAAGWDLVGAAQRGWNLAVVTGTAGYDGMCRPAAYQAFVFVDGAFVGTLAPEPMMSRTDGALGRVTLQDATNMAAEFTRYAPDDALCCPSRMTTVSYTIQDGLVHPASASTSSTSTEQGRR